MRAIADADGPNTLSDADRHTLIAAGRYGLGLDGPIDPDAITPVTPAELALAVGSPEVGDFATRFCAVMALVDGTIDDKKLDFVGAYASALGLHADYVTELAETAKGHVDEALADMTRQNLLSVTGKEWILDDVNSWLLPYEGDNADPALTAKYHELGTLPEGTLGRAFYNWYTGHGFAFPGTPSALNEAFGTPHDSIHILSGYSTTPQGELLVSTFTAGMHPEEPMAGHILPVIYSWHIGVKINDVAGAFHGALDPEKFFVAWDRGAAVTGDFFAHDWDFWATAPRSLEELQSEMTVPTLPSRRRRQQRRHRRPRLPPHRLAHSPVRASGPDIPASSHWRRTIVVRRECHSRPSGRGDRVLHEAVRS